jgi:hypothetical protein
MFDAIEMNVLDDVLRNAWSEISIIGFVTRQFDHCTADSTHGVSHPVELHPIGSCSVGRGDDRRRGLAEDEWPDGHRRACHGLAQIVGGDA